MKKHNYYENNAWKAANTVVGVDEVGRGCFAGPVVAAAVMLPKNTQNDQLKDSKKMSALARKTACAWIKKHTVFGIGVIHARLIDQYNIYQSSIIAMKKALLQLIIQCEKNPNVVLIDAITDSFYDILSPDTKVYAFPFAEDQSSSVAAASILAKVTRDSIMDNFSYTYPHYFFEKHKGYATKLHINALDQYGESLIHRKTFLRKYYQRKIKVAQQTLF